MTMYWIFFQYPRKGQPVLGLSVSETHELVSRLRKIPAHVFAVPSSTKTLFQDFFTTYKQQPRNKFRALILRTLALEILLTIIRHADNRPSLPAMAKITHLAKLIRKRPSYRFTLDELAAHLKISTSHFTVLFRRIIGLPPYAYLSKCRLESAQCRLTTTTDSIAKIAHDLGYNSPQHLATQFRQTYGITPSEYRGHQTVNRMLR